MNAFVIRGLIVVVVVLAFTLFVVIAEAQPEYGIGVGYGQATGDSDSSAYLKGTLGWEDKPYYLWGTYEETTSRLLGQPMADTDIYSVGLGLKATYNELYLFGELGYAYLSHDQNETIRQEVVYTDLVETHNVYNRPIPIGEIDDRLGTPNGPYSQDYYSTYWETREGITGAVGIGYKIGDFGLEFSYRPLYVKEHLELYDQEIRENGGGYWQESRQRDYSNVRLGINYAF